MACPWEDETGMICPVCETGGCREFITVTPRKYHFCKECGAVFLEPLMLPTPDEELARYVQHRNDPFDSGYRRFLSRLAVPLLERIPAGLHGLDFGCGFTHVLAGILEGAGHKVELFDPFFFPDTSVLENKYDFVVCSEVAEHFHRPALEFSRLRGLLMPGGVLGIMTRFLTKETDFRGWHYRRDPAHVVFYRERTFEVIARKGNWNCEIPARDIAFLFRPQQGRE